MLRNHFRLINHLTLGSTEKKVPRRHLLINLVFHTFFSIIKLNVQFLEFEFFCENLTFQLDHKGNIEG